MAKARAKGKNGKKGGSVLSDPEAVARLLLLLLVKLGADSDEIGAALGVHAGSVRNLIPMRRVTKLTNGSD